MDVQTLRLWEQELVATQQRADRQLAHVRALLADCTGDPTPTPTPTPSSRRSKTQNEVAADATYGELKDLGAPIDRKNLYDHLLAQGFAFAGRNPINAFGAILSRDSRFETTGVRGSWGLSEWTQREAALVEESRPSLLNDAAVPEPVDGPALDAGGLPSPSGFETPLRHQQG